jgi:pyruvate dehydrogenase E2 component (dihydrolipoamide acetyltransferase)
MPTIEIKIPQLGEGLQEARILRFLKQPGEPVTQDEPIFEMETDKAVMEIESPAAGVLEAWTVAEDAVVPIGAVIGRIAAEDSRGEARLAPTESPLTTTPSAPAGPSIAGAALRNVVVPPRTRAYAREKGLSDEELARLAAAAEGKLLPEAIDRYLAERAPAAPREVWGPAYRDMPLPPAQRTLVYRLQRATQTVIPATMEMPVPWKPIEDVRNFFKQRATEDGDPQPTQFLLFAWCVAQAAKKHPRFLCSMPNDNTLRQYEHLHLGIAVARPNDELLTARVENADALPFPEFIRATQAAIARARAGEDQATEAMQISLTNLAHAGVRLGIPVVVAPAVATLFIGTPYDEAYPLPEGGVGFRRTASMVLGFDHRLVNGLGAANFLTDIRAHVERLPAEFGVSGAE